MESEQLNSPDLRKKAAESAIIEYPAQLPISARVPELLSIWRENPVIIVSGATGSGKTTQLPKVALQLGCTAIGCTQPRRIAALAMAKRIAAELKVPFGSGVGCKMRFQENTSPETFLKFMTDGILLAESRSDRQLYRYDCLIIDEAHERSLNIDFLLGYLKLLRKKRPALKIAISSATLNVQEFSEFFGNAPVIDIEGRTFPVEDIFLPPEADEETPEHIARAVELLSRYDKSGDILVFLPGEREIRDAAEMLEGRRFPGTEILQLYGRLSSADQQKVFHPGNLRRIILSTNVAETSLTIPNVKFCIDSGMARVKRFNPRTRIEELQLEMISQASANQRRGRCGRTTDGICVHLYGESDLANAAPQTDPEIRRVSLAGAILQMAALKLPHISRFPFLNPPAPPAVREGVRTLGDLRALEPSGELTLLGRRLARLPLDPHLGAMLIAGEKRKVLQELLVISAFLSIRDPREKPIDKEQAAANFHRSLDDENSDFCGILNLWNYLWENHAFDSNRLLRKVCKTGFLSFIRIREWRNLVAEFASAMECEVPEHALTDPPYEPLHEAILTGIPRNIGCFDKENRLYRGTGGRKFVLFPGSGLTKQKSRPEWIMSFAIVETSRIFARTAAVIKSEMVERIAPHLCTSTCDQAHYDENSGFVRARERVSCDGLLIHSGRRIDYARKAPAEAREVFIREGIVPGLLDIPGSWVAEYNDLREELLDLEIRVRRPESIFDTEAACRHFMSVLPPEIYSRNALKTLCAEHPYPFCPPREELMIEQFTPLVPEDYPNWLYFNGTPFQLGYQFEPGSDYDGVTMYVPEEQLNMLPAWALDYLIPGFLPELLEVLLRNLRREDRRRISVANCVQEFLEERETGKIFAEQPLYQALSDFLLTHDAVEVEPEFFDSVNRPEHLRMKLAVMNRDRRIIALHREMPDRTGLGSQLSAAIPGVRKMIRVAESGWPGTDAMPPEIVLKGSDGKCIFPALKIGVKGLERQVFLKQNEAKLRHKEALVKLFRQNNASQVKFITRMWKFTNEMKMSWFLRDSNHRAPDDLTDSCILNAFGVDPWQIRSAAGFVKAEEHAKENMGETADELFQHLQELYTLYSQAEKLIRKADCEELDDHVDLLFAPGFLLREEVWSDYKRYLRGLRLRAERYNAAPSRDYAKGERIEELIEKLNAALQISTIEEDADTHDLWVLSEECRIAVYAPEVPLSIRNPLSRI